MGRFVSVAIVAASLAQAPSLVTVHGRVVDAARGAPVAGVEIALNVWTINGASRTTTSGDDGRFFFRDVPSDKYYLFGKKDGFFTAGLNDESQPGCSDLLVVGWPGPPPLTLKLRPHGSITGTVLDEAGRAVTGATVRLLEKQRDSQSWGRKWIWAPVDDGYAVTDKSGRYVIDPAEAGNYAIEVDAAKAPVSGPEQRTYGTTHAGQIHLGIGEKRNFDVGVTSRPAFDLAGVIAAPVELHSVYIQLLSVDPITEERRPLENVWTRHDGAFRFDRLPAGDYVLAAQQNDNFWAEQRVVIQDRSVIDVQLRLTPALEISGKVIWEGVESPPAQSSLVFRGPMGFEGYRPSSDEIERMRVELPISLASLAWVGPKRGLDINSYNANWTSETTFKMKLPAGRYLTEGRSAGGWFVKSFRIDGRETVDEPVEIVSGSTNAVLTLTRSIGEVDLKTVNAAGSPEPYCGFVLFTANRRVWPGVSWSTTRHWILGFTVEEARTQLKVMPGEYYVAAVSIEALDDVDQETLTRLAASAAKFSVPPNVPISRTITCVR